jgi:hypothetical protein
MWAVKKNRNLLESNVKIFYPSCAEMQSLEKLGMGKSLVPQGFPSIDYKRSIALLRGLVD